MCKQSHWYMVKSEEKWWGQRHLCVQEKLGLTSHKPFAASFLDAWPPISPLQIVFFQFSLSERRTNASLPSHIFFSYIYQNPKALTHGCQKPWDGARTIFSFISRLLSHFLLWTQVVQSQFPLYTFLFFFSISW